MSQAIKLMSKLLDVSQDYAISEISNENPSKYQIDFVSALVNLCFNFTTLKPETAKNTTEAFIRLQNTIKNLVLFKKQNNKELSERELAVMKASMDCTLDIMKFKEAKSELYE